MKKLIVYFTFMTNILTLLSMEKPIPTHSYCINGTNINLSCDNLLTKTEHKKRSDIIVVGEHEQKFLTGSRELMDPIGNISYGYDKNIFIKSEAFKLYLNNCHIRLGARFAGYRNYDIEPAYTINVDSMVIKVIEPKLLIAHSKNEHKPLLSDKKETVVTTSYMYPKIIYNNNNPMRPMIDYYYEERAIEKALEDLSLCYKNVLEKAYTLFTTKHQEKSIMLPFLSSLLGIPKEAAAQVAITSLRNFLMNDNNKNKYGSIEIMLDHEEDINLFKKHLQCD